MKGTYQLNKIPFHLCEHITRATEVYISHSTAQDIPQLAHSWQWLNHYPME